MNDSAIGWKLFGGYRINRYFAIESSWTDLGKPDDRYLGHGVSVEIDGLVVSALGIIPIHEKFEIFGKIGLYAWQATAKVEGIDIVTDDGIDPTYGIGAAFNASEGLTFRSEWQSYNISDIDETSFLSFSVVHYFQL